MNVYQIILLIFLLFIISCKSQVTYKEKVLINQSHKVILQNKNCIPTDKIKVEDIIGKLRVKPLQYSASPDSSEYESPGFVETLILHFYSDNKEFRYKMDNNIKLYSIYIKLKDSIHIDQILQVNRNTNRRWNKDATQYFGNMEVKEVKIYDLEN